MTARSTRPARIAIVGAGPVGLAIAALLATSRAAQAIEIRVIDSGPAPRWGDCDLRVYALSRASQGLFERLGLWSEIVARRACPYRRMRVWESDPTARVLTFDCADIGEPDLGHIVEDSLLRRVLYELLSTCSNVRVTTDQAVEAVRLGAAGANVHLAGGESARADLLIAADGAASRVRSLLDFPVAVHDYAQAALVTHVASEFGHDETALQRFLPGGPLALLPLMDGRSSVVWSLPTARAAELTECSSEVFLQALQEASGAALGRLGACAQRVAFRLGLLHALDYTRPGVALAGDAAHSVHPLAGQGMNLGLLDALCLAEEIECGLERGLAVGDAALLRRYERRRKGHNVQMMLALDALDRWFRMPAWTEPVRGLGLSLLERAGPLKRSLMSNALGLAQAKAASRSRSAA